MSYIEEKCPSCGGPLPAASFDWLTCKFCGAELKAAPGAQYRIPPKLDEPPFEPNLPRVSVVGSRFVLLGKLARGTTSDVFLARRDARITETVVVKIALTPAKNGHLDAEWKAIGAIDDRKREGAAHFARLLPQRVVHGKIEGEDRSASVFRWRAGFQYTFEDARAEYKDGIDPRAAVWMWKRVLEMIGWIRDGGWAHCAIDPSHLVIHPRDNDVILVGWSKASRGPTEDVAMSARAIAYVLGGDAENLPARVPQPIADLLKNTARQPNIGAWHVKDELDRAAQLAFGAPRYQRFTLDGWG